MMLAIWAVVGIVLGYLLEGKWVRIANNGMLVSALVLVGEIGYELGIGTGEGQISLGEVVFQASLLAVIASLFSLLVSLIIIKPRENALTKRSLHEKESIYRDGNPFLVSLLFAFSLVLGFMFGYDGLNLPRIGIDYLLYFLLFTAGYGVGGLGSKLRYIWGEAGAAGLKLSIATLVGGFIGGSVVWAATGWNFLLGAGAGVTSGWYSLGGPLLMSVDPAMGAVAFLGNLFRETIHIVLYPILARWFPLNAIVVGGATTMDTGLPPVMLAGGSELALVAFIHGAILTVFLGMFLPFYVGLFT